MSSHPLVPTQSLPLRAILSAVAGIYVTQSLISTLGMQSLPALIRQAGGSLGLVGSSSLLMLPWALKFAWSPWIERWRLPYGKTCRRSRPLILAGQLTLVILLAAIAMLGRSSPDLMFDATSLGVLFMMLMLCALLAASVDIACDGFCVDQLHQGQRGWGNLAQVGGSYLGMTLGGGVFLLLCPQIGWPQAILLLAGAILLMTLPLWCIQEPATRHQASHRPTLRHALARPAIWRALALVMGLNAGLRLVLPLLAPLLLDNRVSMNTLGWLFGTGTILTGIGGSVLGGLLVSRLGQNRGLTFAYGLQALALLLIGLVQSLAPLAQFLAQFLAQLPHLLMALLLLQMLATACCMVCIYTLLMGASSPMQPGVDFTLFQCADAAVAILAGIVGGQIAQHLGYGISFILAALLTLAALGMNREAIRA